MAVGELNALAEFEHPMQTVLGNFPGLGQSGFGGQRLPVDMNQVRHQPLQHLPGTRVGGDCPIQGFGFGSLRGNQASAGTSGRAGNQQTVIDSGVERPHQDERAEGLSQGVHQESNYRFRQ